MQRLRRQVDQIDLKLLRLLQQRIKIAGQIGRAKRRYGAEIYVPGRERELLERMTRLADGKISSAAVNAIFREILSSSRAAQGQAPIGVLHKDEPVVVSQARRYFGACDQFVVRGTWRELAADLTEGKLSLGVVDGASLPKLADLGPDPRILVTGEIEISPAAQTRIFIVKSIQGSLVGRSALILIGKSTPDAVKSLISAMPFKPVHVEQLMQASPREARLLLQFSIPMKEDQITAALPTTAQLLGLYTPNEDYGR